MSECVIKTRTAYPGEEGLRDLKIIMAVYSAAKTGKTVKLKISFADGSRTALEWQRDLGIASKGRRGAAFS